MKQVLPVGASGRRSAGDRRAHGRTERTALGQRPQLRDVRPEWFVILFVLEVAPGRLGPRAHAAAGHPRPTVGSAQLAGLASGCVLPGGSATGSVIQASVLVRAGNGADRW